MSAALRPRRALSAAAGAVLAVLAAAFAVLAAGCVVGEPETEVATRSAVQRGEALFRDPAVADSPYNSYACATCHDAGGAQGAASSSAGAPILPGAALAGVTRRPSFWGGAELDLLRSINHCFYYFMLGPVWTGEEPEAEAMYAYLESISGEGTSSEPWPFTMVVELASPPAGDAARGADVYDRACASCHGEVRTGSGRLVERASILPEQWLADHPPSEYTPLQRRVVLVEKVRHGAFLGYGGQMPPYSRELLSDQAIGDLLALFGVD